MTPPQPNRRDSTSLLTASLVVTFAAIAVTALVPAARDWRLWGVNHLSFYGMPVRLAALIVVAVAFVPSVARPVYATLRRIPQALEGDDNRPLVAIILLSVASVFLFYELRAATTLLGDGQLLVTSFEVGQKGHKTVIMRSVEAILRNETIAPGMTLMYYGLVELATGTFGRSVADSLVVLPCLLGGLWVFLLLKLVRAVPVSPAIKVWLLVLGAFTASLQLFFGYIENYSGILVFLGVYVATGFMFIHRRIGLWAPLVVLIVSTYTHIQSIVFAPSLVYLAAWRFSGRRADVGARILVPAVLALTVGSALVGRALQIPGDFYLPWTADDESYGVLSPGHLLDMLNEMFLLFPAALFVVAAWAAGRRIGDDTPKPASVWFTKPQEWQFVAVMLGACFVYMSLFEPEIGMARDWDLFTMTTAALIPFGLLAINRYILAARLDDTRAAVLFVPAMVMTAVLAVSWIGVNTSADRTTHRFESILAYDQTHVGYAYENLATFYYEHQQLPEAIQAMEKGALISGNPRIYARLAAYYQENGDINAGIDLLTGTVKTHPRHQKARQKLLDLLEKARRWDELVDTAREGMQYYPRQSIYCFALGIGLFRTGRADEGADVMRKCLELDAPPKLRAHMQRFIDTYEE